MGYGPIENAKPVVVEENALLIRISRVYHSNMTPLELYEATRGTWRLGPRRNKAEFAFAVYHGVVVEVYRINRWLPAGSTDYTTRNGRQLNVKGRWEFEGAVDKELSERYVGKSVRDYLDGQNPTVYVGCC